MTATLTAPITSHQPKFFRTAATAGVVAGVATAAVAAVAHAAGVSLDVSGSAIPVVGFAQLTFVFVMIGAIIAVALTRWARRPRHAFVVTTLVLTLASFTPDVLADARISTKLTLILTHVVAAAIAIPALTGRFSD